MGNHALGTQIGVAAQSAFEHRSPNESALSIFDRLCMGRGGDAEWEAEDPDTPGHVHPEIGHYTDPTPAAGLGMLMVEAFAPNGLADLPKYAGALGYFPSEDEDEDRRRAAESESSTDLWWKEVYDPFRLRYKFW